MFPSVSGLEQPLATAVAALDPAALRGSDARRELLAVIRMQKLLDGAFIRLVGRVDQTRAWTGEGDRTLEAWLLRNNGGSYRDTKQATDTAGLLGDAPSVDDALKKGKLSADQAAALAPAEKEAPTQAGRLVDAAASQTLRDTKQAAERARASARTPDQEAQRAAKQHTRRRLVFGTDDDGNGTIDAHLPPTVFAEVKAELERLFKPIFAAARADGRFEPHPAYLADALIEMTRRSRAGTPKKQHRPAPADATSANAGTTAADGTAPTRGGGGGDPAPDSDPAAGGSPAPSSDRADDDDHVKPAPASKTAVNIIIDLDTLRGRPRGDGDQRCEIAGVGPVSAAWVRDQLGDATLNLFLRKGIDLTTLATPSRSPTQTIAVCLDLLYPCCAIDGCENTRGLQDHHDTSPTGWNDTRRTKLTELTRLCTHHHDLVTHEHYTLVRGPTPTTATLQPPDVPAPPRKRRGKNRRRPTGPESSRTNTPDRPPVPAPMGPIALPFGEGGPDG